MTDHVPLSPAVFYDALASNYDEMTGFDQRFVREKPFFRLLVERYKIGTALDAGSGTGFHSILLARLGVQVTAVDVSEEMLGRLQQHALNVSPPVAIVKASFQKLPPSLDNHFDAVFCLGNSLAHLLTDEDVGFALTNFRRSLVSGGVLAVQTLNYDRILAERSTIQNVKQVDGKTFIRFYTYNEKTIDFSILTVDAQDDHGSSFVRSVALRPLTREALTKALTAAGFSSMEVYGGITLEPFDELRSKDLVVIAHNDY